MKSKQITCTIVFFCHFNTFKGITNIPANFEINFCIVLGLEYQTQFACFWPVIWSNVHLLKKTWWLHSITLIGLSNCNIRAVLRMLLCVVEIRLTIQISVSVQGFLGISIIWSRYCACIGRFFLIKTSSLIMDTLLEFPILSTVFNKNFMPIKS